MLLPAAGTAAEQVHEVGDGGVRTGPRLGDDSTTVGVPAQHHRVLQPIEEGPHRADVAVEIPKVLRRFSHAGELEGMGPNANLTQVADHVIEDPGSEEPTWDQDDRAGAWVRHRGHAIALMR